MFVSEPLRYAARCLCRRRMLRTQTATFVSKEYQLTYPKTYRAARAARSTSCCVLYCVDRGGLDQGCEEAEILRVVYVAKAIVARLLHPTAHQLFRSETLR